VIASFVATFFGIGRAPFAPGTIASFVALPFAWLILFKLGPTALVAASLIAFAIGVWACDLHARKTGVADPSECVIDEVAGQWLACAVAPLSPLGFTIAFALFRLFDITKVWPVSEGEKLKGGWGIMVDDMLAGGLAALIISVLRWQGFV
jgi:phosphatidylglycerophosphatase A